jgi:hypothetical protein
MRCLFLQQIVPRKLLLFLISLENDHLKDVKKYASPKTSHSQSYPSKNINSIGAEPINQEQIDGPGWGMTRAWSIPSKPLQTGD